MTDDLCPAFCVFLDRSCPCVGAAHAQIHTEDPVHTVLSRHGRKNGISSIISAPGLRVLRQPEFPRQGNLSRLRYSSSSTSWYPPAIRIREIAASRQRRPGGAVLGRGVQSSTTAACPALTGNKAPHIGQFQLQEEIMYDGAAADGSNLVMYSLIMHRREHSIEIN